jgi:hypothetical protein
MSAEREWPVNLPDVAAFERLSSEMRAWRMSITADIAAMRSSLSAIGERLTALHNGQVAMLADIADIKAVVTAEDD